MIEGNLALFLNLFSVLALTGMLVIAVISVFVRLCANSLDHYSAESRRTMLWLLVLSPWIIGTLAAAIAMFSGSSYWPITDGFSSFHWHHPNEFSFYSWHGLTVAIAAIYITLTVTRKTGRLLKSKSKLNTLLCLADSDDDGFYKLDTDQPAAFTAGYLKPKCFITRALLTQVSEEECSVIKLHEKEHARRFDPFKKSLFQLFTTFFPKRVYLSLNQSLTLAMEQCADEAVTSVIADRSVIAMTLLKVRRMAIKPLDQSIEAGLMCHYGIDSIEQRIAYLLADKKGKVFQLPVAILALLSLSILCAMSADVFHHTIEYSLSHN